MKEGGGNESAKNDTMLEPVPRGKGAEGQKGEKL
jgi:hypothetical protein